MADIITTTLSQIKGGLIAELSRLVPRAIIFCWNLAIAVIIVVIGWVIGQIAKQIVTKALQMLNIDKWAAEHKLQSAVLGMNLSNVGGTFVKWYIILLFTVQALVFIDLTRIEVFGWELAKAIPLWVLAALIMVVGLIVGKFVRNKIEQLQHRFKKTAAGAAEIVIIYISLVTALETIGIPTTILINMFNIAFTGFVLVIAIILGISIGLAFKKEAKDLANEIKREIS